LNKVNEINVVRTKI